MRVALTLSALIRGEAHARAVQLALEYDPAPPRTVKSRRVERAEIGAREAAAVNAAITGFDNSKGYVFETRDAGSGTAGTAKDAHFGSFEEFAGASPPCQPPSAGTAAK